MLAPAWPHTRSRQASRRSAKLVRPDGWRTSGRAPRMSPGRSWRGRAGGGLTSRLFVLNGKIIAAESQT